MSSNKIAILIFSFGVLAAGYIVLSAEKAPAVPVLKNNVSFVNGKQIIEITAKGGYSPENSSAKAGVPTVVRFITDGTFDCSAAIRIPEKKVSKTLPQTGTTDIDLGVPEKGILSGSCGMGMYPFGIEFE